jgi:glycosyltransferase involved in cell wall biosynthesis
MPKISIIMPNYNGEKFIEKSICAFINSSWKNKELIIVDGKSSDSSHSIITKFVNNNDNIIWVEKLDNGISDAINIGLSSSSGEIIGYLGSDDLLMSDTLKIVADYKKIIDFDGIYFDSYTHDYKSNATNYRKCPEIKFTKNNLLRFGTIVGLQNVFFSAYIFDDFKYDINNKYSMDYELYLRVIEKYNHFIHIKTPSSINIAHDNISNALSEKQRKEAFQVAKRHINTVGDFCALYFNKRTLKSFLKFWGRAK